jgi:hypothetical protein
MDFSISITRFLNEKAWGSSSLFFSSHTRSCGCHFEIYPESDPFSSPPVMQAMMTSFLDKLLSLTLNSSKLFSTGQVSFLKKKSYHVILLPTGLLFHSEKIRVLL